MTTAELATALPEIVTEQVPGLKSKGLVLYVFCAQCTISIICDTDIA